MPCRANQSTIGPAAGDTTFNSLPTEIRVMIWKEFVRIPRIIHVDIRDHLAKVDHGFTCRMTPRDGIWSGGFWCVKFEQVCPLLGVNHESRYIALKERLLYFGLKIPVLPSKRFREKHIRPFFAIRSHDILFFHGSESSNLYNMQAEGNTLDIANVMIDLNIRHINYRNLGAIPQWDEMFGVANDLIRKLRNQQRLENFYCLTQRSTAKKKGHFGLDDLRELTPKDFPKKKKDLERWLNEFHRWPAPFPAPFVGLFDPDLRGVWKNVTV